MSKNALAFKKPRMMNKTSLFDKGQYENQFLGDVMKFDASYILWCIEQNFIDVEPYLHDEIVNLEHEQDPYSDYWAAQDPNHPFEDTYNNSLYD